MLPNRELPAPSRRAPRTSRSKSDIVSSTTNGLPSYETSRPGATAPADIVYCLPNEVRSGQHFQVNRAGLNLETQRSTADSVPSSTVTCNGLPKEGNDVSTSNSVSAGAATHGLSKVVGQQQAIKLPVTKLQEVPQPVQVVTVVVTSGSNIPAVASQTSTTSASFFTTESTTLSPTASSIFTIVKDSSHNAPLTKENNLKKVLSEKIRSRQMTEDSLASIPTHNLQFFSDHVAGMGLENKFTTAIIKQEDSYGTAAIVKQEDSYGESSPYDHHYTYSSDMSNSIASFENCSTLAMTSFENGSENLVTLTPCGDMMSSSDANNNGLSGMSYSSLRQIHNEATDNSQLHHSTGHQQHHHGNVNSSEDIGDAMIVQSSQGQYFQVLQPMQHFETQAQVTSTNPATTSVSSAPGNYYSNLYPRDLSSQLLETDKQMVVERYLHQQQQYTYNAGYPHFFGPDSSYNLKSPDSGYQEPCASPSSVSLTHFL